MKRSLRTISYREIRRSFGRFLAIMCIVMLGAGFLAGLRVTETDMLHTMDEYNAESRFFDFKVISTLGLTEDDAKYFSGLSGVEYSEGSVSTDALFTVPKSGEEVLMVHSITDSVNTLKLRSGRLPQAANECVMDGFRYDESAIGTTIKLSDSNKADTLDMFSQKEFTVVGIVNSPLYINFNRGTTTLGSGSVAAFVYVPRSSFSTDYYTEIYVRLANTGSVYSQEYDDAIDAFSGTLNTEAQARAQLRYEDVVAKAQSQYSSAENSYNSGVSQYNSQKTSAEQQLNDAKAKLDAAQAQLPQSRKELDDGWAKLNAGQKELDEGWAQYNASAPAAQAKLDAAKVQLDSGWAQYNEDLENYNRRVSLYGETLTALEKAKLDYTQQQLNAAQAQYDSGVQQLEESKQKLVSAQAELASSRAALEQGENQYAAGLQQLETGRKDYETAKAQAQTKFDDAQQALTNGRVKLNVAKAQIGQIEKPTVYVLDRYTNAGYASFKNDSGIIEGVAKVFPIFFFLVAALVCVTTMNRMVDEQRTQIGTLKSLGYTPWEIMKGYLLYTGAASGVGSFAGVLIGSVAFPKIIWQAYNIMYGFTDILLVFDWGMYAVVCGAFIACSLLVTILSCRSELREAPAELIRPRTPKAGKRIFLEKLPFIWNRFSFLRKVSARNIFRYKKRMFMMIVGIAGCTALLVTAFGLNDSISGLADAQFEKVEIYDAKVNFAHSMTKADEEEFIKQSDGYLESCAFMSMYSVNVDVDGTPKSVYLVGTDEKDMTPFMNYSYKDVKQSYPGDGEVMINDNLARILGVKVGDTITLQDSDMDELTLKVSGIYYNVIYNYAYVTLNTLRGAQGFDANVNSAYLNLSGDVYASAAKVGDLDSVAATLVNEETRVTVRQSLDSMKYVVGLIAFCAGALAFIVLYNLTNININERIREIATIKVLGFRQGETASYVYRENMILTLMGTAAGIPVGIWLHRYVMGNIKIDMVSYDVHINWQSYLLAIALTILFAVVVDVFMYSRLDKINMAESLKSVE